MLNPHEIFDSIESVSVLGIAGLWIYDRLRKSDANEQTQKKLAAKIEDLDGKLTRAMTEMANQVGSLARSVSKLEGQFDIMRERNTYR